jgi:beta-lactamase class A
MAAKHDLRADRRAPAHAAPPSRRPLSNAALAVIATFALAAILCVMGLVSHAVESSRSAADGSADAGSDATLATTQSASSGATSAMLGELATRYAVEGEATQKSAEVQQAIESVTAGYGDSVAVAFVSLADTDVSAGVNGSTAMHSASVLKLLILATLLDEAATGQVDLEETLTVEPDDIVDGTGVIQSQGSGTTYTLRDLAYLMITQSDNVAANMLIERLGFDAINAEAASLGLSGTHLSNEFMSSKPGVGGYNTVSADDMARLLELFATAQVADRDLCAFAVQALADQQIHGAIGDGVPDGVTVAHKTGSYGSVENDAAIVFAGEPYVLVVLCNDIDNSTADQVTAQVSAAVYAVTNGAA